MARTYEDAIKELNTLQSNSSDRDESRKKDKEYQKNKFEKAKKFAARAKLEIEDLDKLAAIHVSGTKGKGSVCAFSERILRGKGLRTGFYSSPHLMEVRERIRIDGEPISKEKFVHYFWECLHNLKQNNDDNDMPSYFVFLTIMSFYVFLHEKVDVAIIEVGIGGTLDTTNMIRHPWVCGVTSLCEDHVELLGETTESIAENKAGIFKRGVPAFTVPQDEISTQVLVQKAKELKAPLKVVPEMCTYPGETVDNLGIEGAHQFRNASLALQLCTTWLERYDKEENGEKNFLEGTEKIDSAMETNGPIPLADAFLINKNFKEALEKTFWPGRTHCIKGEGYTLYLDGAHTPKSSSACSAWFRKKADEEKQSLSGHSVARVLIFNCTGEWVPSELLKPLVSCDFDVAVFCTNFVKGESGRISSDLYSAALREDSILKRRDENSQAWQQLELDRTLRSNPIQLCVSTLSDALHCVLVKRFPCFHLHSDHDYMQVLVTGSLHLVGDAMKVLGKNIENV